MISFVAFYSVTDLGFTVWKKTTQLNKLCFQCICITLISKPNKQTDQSNLCLLVKLCAQKWNFISLFRIYN